MNIKPTILLMDNVLEFLDTTARLLERAGYRVIQTSSIEDADRVMREGRVHLVVLDVRMNADENMVRDIAGLELAMTPEHAALPKIILTAFANPDDAAKALSSLLPNRDVPAALDYVQKRNIDSLLPTIEKAFKRHVRINFELDLHWEQENAFSVLGFIDAQSSDVQTRFAERVEEFESMLGQLFFDYQHVRVLKMAWRHNRLVALSTIAFRDHERQPFLVVCGNRTDTAIEANRLSRYGPPTRPVDATTLSMMSSTTHYAANAYILGGADLQKAVTLRQAFDAPLTQLAKTLETLCGEVLAGWQREKIPVEQTTTLAEWYRGRLKLASSSAHTAAFHARIMDIATQALQLGIGIDYQHGQVTFQFAGLNRKQHTFDNPEQIIFENCAGPHLKLVTQSPRLSSPDTILTQPDMGKVWLTQFAGAGQLPLHADYAALEAMIRFDWLKTTNVQDLYEFEVVLCEIEPFERLGRRNDSADLRPALRLIHSLRQHAARRCGNDALAYHTAMLFESLQRINTFEMGRPLMQNDIAVLVQLLICTTMSAHAIRLLHSSNRKSCEAASLLDVRFEGGEVFIAGRLVELPEQLLKLLIFLHAHAGELCTHKQLFSVYDSQDTTGREDSLTTQLTTYVNRLRSYIEPDPKDPKYLINVRGKGYKLLCKPTHPPNPTTDPPSTTPAK